MRSYAPLISALLPKIFEPPLQNSNVTAPLPQLSALPLQLLSLDPPPPLSIPIQGRGVQLFLPSVAHANVPLIPDLCL